jgi:type I restriction enzyme M protein
MNNNRLTLQKAIVSIYNHLYANSEKKTPHGISKEVGKILHVGMYLEEHGYTQIAFQYDKSEEREILAGNYDKLKKMVHDGFKKMNQDWKIYNTDEGIDLKDYDLAYTCVQLNGIKISDTNRDVFGDSLEIFRSQFAKQVGGQFFTDSLVTGLSMKLLDFDPRKGDDLIDICSGTGGFLLSGLNHIREIIESSRKSNKDIEKEVIKLARQSIRGQEYDKEICSIANSTLNARIGEGHTYIKQGDSLEYSQFASKNSEIKFDSHLCVAGNPPFGTKITIKDPKILEKFELARVKARQNELFPTKVTSRAPDILFLEQNIKLLKPGKGRMSLVVPYQILSGPQTLYIRNWLLLQTEILSVVDLPAETFQPHTGTKGILLTLKRRKEPLKSFDEIQDYDIFMSVPRWIGHDRRGNPVFKKEKDGTMSGELLTDFQEVEKAYLNYKKGESFDDIHKESFKINIKNVLDSPLLQLNAQFHKPSQYNTVTVDNKKWKVEKLYNLVESIFYPGRFARGYIDKCPGAIPFFGGKEIIQTVVESNKWLSPNHPKLKELSVKSGWILITRSGTTGIVSFVPEAWNDYAMSEHVIRIVPNTDKIDPYYLLAFLKTNYCQSMIDKGVYGSVIDSITPDFIGNLDVLIPKDKGILEKIVKNIKESEKARNEALLKSYSGITEIDKLIN